jgi:two-component system sensor kinase FixL
MATRPVEPASGATRGDGPVPRLHRRYLASFGVVALLLLLNQLLVQPQFFALAIDPATINRAGRQRMLGQRLAKAALAVVRAGRDGDRRRYLDELAKTLADWSAAHEQLRGSLDERTIRAEFGGLEPSFRRLQAASSRLIRAYSPPGVDRGAGEVALEEILAEEGAYLGRMDRIVGLYEARARARIDRLLWTGRALTALVFVALIALGLFVLRPAAGIIRRQLADLQRARDELEGRVRERTQALEEANRRLVGEAERRSLAEARHRAALELASHASRASTLGEMASGLAHELNQPLGAIANYAEGCLVELGREAPDLAEARAALRKLLASTLRAGEVIKRVRRFVTRRGPDREPFDPARALAEAADLMADDARRRRITLRVVAAPDLPWVWGDPVQIQQVLINLVRNACEAIDGSETSTRTVIMGAERLDPDAVAFLVSDDGEGIPADRLGRVFDPYFSTRAEGMGMGLAISRTIVEAHQGTLAVESESGVGTTFRFTLPTAGAGRG